MLQCCAANGPSSVTAPFRSLSCSSDCTSGWQTSEWRSLRMCLGSTGQAQDALGISLCGMPSRSPLGSRPGLLLCLHTATA